MLGMYRLRRTLVWLLLSGAVLSAPAAVQARPPLPVAFDLQLVDSPKAIVDEVWQTVNSEYVDATFNKQDWQRVRQQLLSREYASKADAYKAIRTALEGLGDPYTRFLEPREFQALTEETSGQLIGVGVTLRPPSPDRRLPQVVATVAGGPAARAGVHVEDQLVAVDGRPTTDVPLPEVTRRIRGENGTQVTLTVLRNRKQKIKFTLTRAPIELPVVTAALKSEQGQKLGYIRLAEFSARATSQVKKALLSLRHQGAQGWIFDLRSNPGGAVDAAIGIANLFLENGNIVSVIDREGVQDTVASAHRPVSSLPMVVLVDGGSASASEILAGALQDNRRATLVGTKTFGKALVQQMNALSDGSGLNVTIAHYLTPAGQDIGHKGLNPDIVAPFPEQLRKKFTIEQVATAADPQYKQGTTTLLKALTPPPQATSPSSQSRSGAQVP
ncbi:S41 family peptidase [Gloeobacter kilaueensis]|uniref:C-terminal processing peptidase n=1 Tax=Gloeobacter kilaueensis (strain ATCC BAA-2537 / CCAP 1431/1 / ULC 316 / JS1) TaxID=1183438 RepID=U5QJD4_GLOK1|nr:S41 family peptidase [Gloeobacter kilaueensis]AGY58978.1 carboxyl-terminal protease [Gloeobacter kilaueensis JS1]